MCIRDRSYHRRSHPHPHWGGETVPIPTAGGAYCPAVPRFPWWGWGLLVSSRRPVLLSGRDL
eukprot:1934939-Pyramimonas_sp.AAC.1